MLRKFSSPLIVIGELYYGAFYAEETEKGIKDIQDITSKYDLLTIDEDTTIAYGKIKAALRKKGKPIPENDIWIAAITIRNDLTVVTRDRHFNEIDDLKIKKW